MTGPSTASWKSIIPRRHRPLGHQVATVKVPVHQHLRLPRVAPARCPACQSPASSSCCSSAARVCPNSASTNQAENRPSSPRSAGPRIIAGNCARVSSAAMRAAGTPWPAVVRRRQCRASSASSRRSPGLPGPGSPREVDRMQRRHSDAGTANSSRTARKGLVFLSGRRRINKDIPGAAYHCAKIASITGIAGHRRQRRSRPAAPGGTDSAQFDSSTGGDGCHSALSRLSRLSRRSLGSHGSHLTRQTE